MKNNKYLEKVFYTGLESYVSKDFSKSVEAFTKVIDLDPNFVLAFISRGAAFMKMHRINEAIADFDRAIELDPDYPKPYHLRGLARVEAEAYKEALGDFGNAINLDPDYGPAYYSRAMLQVKLGREDLATEDLQMVNVLTEMNTQAFANENNIWRSQHLSLEEMGVADPMDR